MKSRSLFFSALSLTVAISLALPTSAFLWFGDDDSPTTADPGAPIAVNLTLDTYKNIAIQSYFQATDNQGDPLTFQLTSTPARGAVTLTQDGGSQFLYTPFENKTGKDSFTYVAIDDQGNTSPQATVTIQISKATTTVSYADMEGDPAHKAAIHLAEENIFVGKQVDGQYYFDGDTEVSRNEFLTMAMTCCDLQPLDGIAVTGFYDDTAIPTWAKGYISSALMAGAVTGSQNDLGQPVFDGDATITQGEASVLLSRLLNISNVQSTAETGHWAEQEVANLTASGVLRTEDVSADSLSAPLTRGEVAILLDGALDVAKNRETGGFFNW